MGRLHFDYRIPTQYGRNEFVRIAADIQQQVNSLSEGKIAARYNAQESMPSGGIYAPGDVVPNSNPTEQGESGSKYVLAGWICVAPPCAFVEQRYLTGN